jgi:hypothetical protein
MASSVYTKELLDRLSHKNFKDVIVRPWLNWIEHLTTDQKVRGSNPLGRATFFCQPRLALFFNRTDKEYGRE